MPLSGLLVTLLSLGKAIYVTYTFLNILTWTFSISMAMGTGLGAVDYDVYLLD